MAEFENKQETEVIVRGVTGSVKWFSIVKGYGFINRKDTNEDVFVHSSAIIQSSPRQLHALDGEQEVMFDVAPGLKGKYVVAVTTLEGKPITDTRVMYRRFGGRRNAESKRGGAKTRDSKKLNGGGDDDLKNSVSEKETATNTDEKTAGSPRRARRNAKRRNGPKNNKKVDGEANEGEATEGEAKDQDSAGKDQPEEVKTDVTAESENDKQEQETQ